VVKKQASSAAKKSSATGKAKAAPAPAAEVLTAEAWAEADLALAEALIAQSRVERGLHALRRKLARRKDKALIEACDALDGEALLLTQGLLRAAKARGLSLFGSPGAEASFDPKRHRPVKGEVAKAAAVKVTGPGVALGRQVLIPAEVKPQRTAKPSSPRQAPPQANRAKAASRPVPAKSPLRRKPPA
jgi:hypothetical protein